MRSRPVSDALSVSEKSPTAAWPLRSSGTAQRPSVRRSVTPSRPIGCPASMIASAFGGQRLAAQRAQELVLSVARDAGDAENLARPHRERDVLERDAEFARLRQAQALRRRALAAPKTRPAGLAISFRFAPIIISAIEREVSRFGSQCRDDLAAAQDGRRVAERDDLVQLVGDVEDRAAARRRDAQRLEQLLDLLRRQHRGRLVHDQQARVRAAARARSRCAGARRR